MHLAKGKILRILLRYLLAAAMGTSVVAVSETVMEDKKISKSAETSASLEQYKKIDKSIHASGNLVHDDKTDSESLLHNRSLHLHIPGDILLGGLFTLHFRSNLRYGKEDVCYGIFSRSAFQSLEAMLMAVQQINNNDNLLPGIKIGVEIMDTCGSVDYAVRQSLNFSFVKRYVNQPTSCEASTKLKVEDTNVKSARQSQSDTVALIGPDTSEIARAIADLAGLFHVPVVSHGATSQVLGDRKRFRHFFRTVPPDTFQTKVIVSLLKHHLWNYVILLTSDDEYGRSGRSALRAEIRMMTAWPICTVIDEVVTSETVRDVVGKIKEQKIAKVIILFSNIDNVIRVINESYLQNLTGYTWIASDEWTEARLVTRNYYSMLQGMLGVVPFPGHIPRFKAQLIQVIKNGSQHNVWAKEFRKHEIKGCTGRSIDACVMDASYGVSPYVGSAFDAVYAVAHALHGYLKCSNVSCNKSWQNIEKRELVESLKNVKFRGVSGKRVSFDWFGSGSSSYQIMNLQKTAQGYNFTTVAEWHFDENHTEISKNFHWTSKIIWNSGHSNPPESVCSRNCSPGEYRNPQKHYPRCCWKCVKCAGNTIWNKTDMSTCSKCREGFYANEEKTLCLPITDRYPRWTDPIVKMIVSLASLGLVLVTFAFLVFLKFRETPIVRAASRGLCYLLLLGDSLFYLLPFTLIGKPEKWMCNSLPLIFGLCLALNVGTMLVKTNRIARIFSKKSFRKQTRYLSNNWQYFMVLCIIIVEEVISLVWILALDPPRLDTSYVDGKDRIITCSVSQSPKGSALWGCYNAGLILVCTYQAFLVRKVPNNYNEAKFIAFTMSSMCISILVYVPLNFDGVGYSKDIISSFLLIFVATVEFFCIFAPKIYIILIRPNKNIAFEVASSPSLERRTRHVVDFDNSRNEAKDHNLELHNSSSIGCSSAIGRTDFDESRNEARKHAFELDDLPEKESNETFQHENRNKEFINGVKRKRAKLFHRKRKRKFTYDKEICCSYGLDTDDEKLENSIKKTKSEVAMLNYSQESKENAFQDSEKIDKDILQENSISHIFEDNSNTLVCKTCNVQNGFAGVDSNVPLDSTQNHAFIETFSGRNEVKIMRHLLTSENQKDVSPAVGTEKVDDF